MPEDQPTRSDDAVFSMAPQEVLWSLARQFVDGQRTIAQLTRTAHTIRNAASDDPEAAEALADFDKTVNEWLTEALPSLAASMKVAIEVHETFGPGMTTVEDPTDAAIWNNKYFVWFKELGGQTP
ncbi:hypothetical protein [Mycobacterium lehmannii]|uniref:hypothetical protein n=1 Tax=Mycobacterium lehmannii TaxID=2048550 RepID=UPI000B944868|nr:hypothetical protein [Mycobacterium lehmannii]